MAPRKLLQILILALAGLLAATAARAAAIVGEVSMVIGVGRLTAADGAAQEIGRGMSVHAGDRIETEAGGHVYIRFVDGGLVSVRPLSRLTIEDYRRDPNAADTAIRFRLDQGVMRSVTGRWGEEAHDKFRLNTPIAAIGIKGTDFVVKADGDRTLASVFSGAIVMAPLHDACRMTLGPCQVGQTRLLTAEMQGKMLELSRHQGAPVLVPAVDLLAQSRQAAEKLLTASSYDAPAAQIAADEARVATTTSVATTAAAAAALPPVAYGQLSWARFGWGTALAGDGFSRSFDAALQSGMQATVGDLGYVLMRQGDGAFKPADTAASFGLAQSAAQLVLPGGRTEAVQAGGGILTVDFAHSTFATQLGLTGASLGSATINANGIVEGDGVFRSQSGNAFVAGAISANAREAGYLFESALPQGSLSGVTLWRR